MPDTFPVPSSPISTATCRAPRPGATAATRCRPPKPPPRRSGAWASKRAGRSSPTTSGNGAYASRLWWMLRWLGHDAVAVLDGGFDAWQRAGLPLATDVPAPRSARFAIRRVEPTVDTGDVVAALGHRRADADRRARRGALSRRRRAAGPGGRAHSRRRQPPVHRQSRRRRPVPAGRGAAGGVRAAGGRARARPRSSTSAAPASPPATTCWRWRSPGSPARASIRARGASGAPTRRARSRQAREPTGEASRSSSRTGSCAGRATPDRYAAPDGSDSPRPSGQRLTIA